MHNVMIEHADRLTCTLQSASNEDESRLPDQFASSAEYRKTVMTAIDKLPLRQKEAILLHYYDRLDFSEIAEVMDATLSEVSIHLQKAIMKIKHEVEVSLVIKPETEQNQIEILSRTLSTILFAEGDEFALAHETWLTKTIVKCGEMANDFCLQE